jgi:hypothetical protein
MAKKRRVTRHPWTKQHEQELRRHSKNKSALKTVAQSMKRTPGALRQKGLFPWSAAWASPFKQEEKEPVIATT